MGRSVVAASNRDREHGDVGSGLAGAQIAAARVPASPVPPQRQPDQTDAARPESGDAVPNNGYVIPQGYGPVNDGYYYPSVIGVPIVILPGENGSSPDMLARQRRRQIELENRYRQNPNSVNPT